MKKITILALLLTWGTATWAEEYENQKTEEHKQVEESKRTSWNKYLHGYQYQGDPTGQKVKLGHDEGERGDYDFSDDMRNWQVGVDFGIDWRLNNRWGLCADLSWGLNGIFKKDFETIEQTMYPIYGSVGITYQLK